jgi:hypothetical protein
MLRRVAYLLIALAVIVILVLPIIAFVLAARGELMLGNEEGSYLRLFLVNSDEAEGIGIQRARQLRAPGDCVEGSVRYLLWEGYGQKFDASYCTCVNAEADPLTLPGQCAP